MPNKGYHVTPKGDQWATQKAGGTRASSLHDTQAAAINAARGYLGNQGGGELNVHGRNGAIRAKDTIAPGNDPRSTKG